MAEARISRGKLALTIVAGLALGAGSAVWATRAKGMGGEDYSGWSGSRVTGSPDAGPWLRAQVAFSGLLALQRSQAIYFTARTDSEGQPLREGCRYRITGGAMPGKWWSVTVYAADNYLPVNSDGALSFDATEVKPDAAGNWSALAATRPEPGLAWVSTRNAGQFDMTLRIYQPDRSAQDDFRSIPMPRITRLDCAGAA
ncbi:MAG TPA: DUF1214 domain-containing protein [Novosphingobium sp.]|nr:DUF1214 domain-containing protein [Novosphingobium sp.]HPZ46921.1 DUF1214 domain-containing protein [Novosphingobium sp.]HQD98983.1 DUF1214 domain-containing protein [Novosphingobium sp.]